MRKLYLLLLSLVFSNVYSQEIPIKEVETDVCEVTVFLEGAQIMRKKLLTCLREPPSLSLSIFLPLLMSRAYRLRRKVILLCYLSIISRIIWIKPRSQLR